MSTKITEHDLDPNVGFAKEETTQEILEKIENVKRSTETKEILMAGDSLSANTTKDVLVISGAGELLWAAYTQQIRGSAQFKIEIDGNVIADAKVAYSSSSNVVSSSFCMYNNEHIFNTGTNYLYLLGKDKLLEVYVGSGGSSKILTPEFGEVISETSGVCVLYPIAARGIRFNNSLKITVNNTGQTYVGNFVAGYTLDEE